MNAANDRKRQISDDDTAKESDSGEKLNLTRRPIRQRHEATVAAATRADPPGQQGCELQQSTVERSVEPAAASLPVSSREPPVLQSSSNDTQRALARLRASQGQHSYVEANAQQNQDELRRSQLAQQRQHQQLQLQQQQQQQDHLNRQQQSQDLNNSLLLQALQHRQNQQERNIILGLQLQQQRQQLPPSINPLLLQQNRAVGTPNSLLSRPTHSEADRLANPVLQAQLMQLLGQSHYSTQLNPLAARALALQLGNVNPQNSALSDLRATGGLGHVAQQGVDPAIVRSAATVAIPQAATTNAPATIPTRSGRDPVLMVMPADKETLSSYQCFIRKHIEFFEATAQDVKRGAQGRNKPIVLGQVGLRCIHCKHVPFKQRAKASTYYPAKLLGSYIFLVFACLFLCMNLRCQCLTCLSPDLFSTVHKMTS